MNAFTLVLGLLSPWAMAQSDLGIVSSENIQGIEREKAICKIVFDRPFHRNTPEVTESFLLHFKNGDSIRFVDRYSYAGFGMDSCERALKEYHPSEKTLEIIDKVMNQDLQYEIVKIGLRESKMLCYYETLRYSLEPESNVVAKHWLKKNYRSCP